MTDTHASERSRILVIDDHAILREALEFIIGQQDDLEVCGSVDGCASARELLETVTPDLALVDLSLGDCEGRDLVAELHERFPSLPILVLSMHDETLYARQVHAAGARGYLMKDVASEQLITAIRRLLAGGAYFSDAITALIDKERS